MEQVARAKVGIAMKDKNGGPAALIRVETGTWNDALIHDWRR